MPSITTFSPPLPQDPSLVSSLQAWECVAVVNFLARRPGIGAFLGMASRTRIGTEEKPKFFFSSLFLLLFSCRSLLQVPSGNPYPYRLWLGTRRNIDERWTWINPELIPPVSELSECEPGLVSPPLCLSSPVLQVSAGCMLCTARGPVWGKRFASEVLADWLLTLHA